MDKSTLKFLSKISIIILIILGLIELALALWTILDNRYKSLAYNLADVGYIDLWILRYLSLCLFASSIITLVMSLILIWGLYSAHVFLFIGSTMIVFILMGEFIISIVTFRSKYETRLTLIEQLPKLVVSYRTGTDDRAKRALDVLQLTFRCCGADGRLSFQNNVPFSCNMFSIGCLTRTIFFLDSCMDALAYILLFFSLIKLLIILFFYSFLCVYQRYRHKHRKSKRFSTNDSSIWRRSSSFDSSSTDDIPKKFRLASTITNKNDYNNEHNEKRHVRLNEYESSSTPSNKQIRTSLLNENTLTTCYDEHPSRKLSSISEKTERTETDDSESDLSRLKISKSKRKAIITSVNQNQPPSPPSKRLPVIKARRMIIRDDENNNDSGVERSSSEKSIDEQNISKQIFIDSTKDLQQINNKSPPSSLGFSKIFVTSVSQNENEIKKPLTTTISSSSSSSITDHLFSNNITIIPKPILKKSNKQLFIDQKIILPKPFPRSSNIKQLNQDESLL